MTDRLAILEAALVDTRLRLRELERQLASHASTILMLHARLRRQELGVELEQDDETGEACH